jgi:glutamate/tyrosine decarboxylase-like PLP-dependent enzyme
VLKLEKPARTRLWAQIEKAIEDYIEGIREQPVTPPLDPDLIRSRLRQYDFCQSSDPAESVRFVLEGLLKYQVHASHPSYFGLFNPNPTTMGIVADALVAAFNPQLAAWSHSPFAAEIEVHLVRACGSRFGYDPVSVDGTFCSGGAEANHTALLAALACRSEDDYLRDGVCAFEGLPSIYVSAGAHHSFVKAASVSGIGSHAVRMIPVDQKLRMRLSDLESTIEQDLREGRLPLMVVATAGTTGTGAIDPISSIASVARERNLWFHLDAAWGGAAALVPELRSLLDGCDLADSITFDAHKWLSVPMGAGLFLTRHPDILARTFRTGNTYMPKEAAKLDIVDPYAHSLQWSRRFIGLKVFLSLAVAGWDGYAETIRHQTRMGDRLRRELAGAGWQVVNDTPLPVVCFDRPDQPEGFADAVVQTVLASGQAWISTVRIGERSAIRACITNYETNEDDLRRLVSTVSRAAAEVTAPGSK